jgi:hypothetical protein
MNSVPRGKHAESSCRKLTVLERATIGKYCASYRRSNTYPTSSLIVIPRQIWWHWKKSPRRTTTDWWWMMDDKWLFRGPLLPPSHQPKPSKNQKWIIGPAGLPLNSILLFSLETRNKRHINIINAWTSNHKSWPILDPYPTATTTSQT